ncbi:MAG: hypothetical protein ABL934_09620 [Lysobacteraceae bacterium]
MAARTSILVPLLALVCGAATSTALLVWHTSRVPAMPAQAATVDHDDHVLSSAIVPSALPDTTTSVSAARAPAEARRGDLDPVEIRARIEANISTLDTRFAAEAPDAAWAMREERTLGAFFAADALAVQGLPTPDGLEIACRSATCRISARFADPVEAEMTTQRLAMHVAADMPYGAVMPRALDDGSIRVEAWYSSTRIAL